MTGLMGSKAPVFTFPACKQTIVVPVMRGRASPLILPCESTGSVTTRVRPRPMMPSALNRVGCASAPTITVTGGGAESPSAPAYPIGRRVAGGGGRGDVRDRGAGDEGAHRSKRESEQLDRPAHRDLFQHG